MCDKKGIYNFNDIEKKWQTFWQDNKTFKANDGGDKPKYYVLDMFPYPSGQGLHVGHPEGYTASDIIARYKRMKGFNVLHPIGWDAFGLPAEQYAIQTGTHPAQTTKSNIDNMRNQIKSLGFSYDWDREINTTDPKYFKWTQWIFLKFFNSYFDESWNKAADISLLEDALAEEPKRMSEWKSSNFLKMWYIGSRAWGNQATHMHNSIGISSSVENSKNPSADNAALRKALVEKIISEHRLAYEAEVAVNWCQELGTVLANEEVINGLSERGSHPVIRKPMRQWMLRITKYSERLLDGLEDLDWTESIKKLQHDWIGKSTGAEVDFALEGFDEKIRVFTTRPDTLFGATYMVMAPEHPLVPKITADSQKQAVDEYLQTTSHKSDLDRTDLAKDKTGVATGAYAVNPVNGKKIPIWISDYVLISYGTGAIMAVPAHDDRDFEFANKFGLEIIQVVEPPSQQDKDAVAKGQLCFCGIGRAINSGKFDGLSTPEFKEKISNWLEEKGLGQKAVNYKLRDWLFSRQRYWGEPFPLMHHEDGSIIALTQDQLPLTLPQIENYKPAGSGEPPLSNAPDWVNVTLPDGAKAKRELNTMPQWAGSCWYYLRYIDPDNNEAFCDSEKEKYWMNVDLYIGGAEHAVLHLLYSRFWHKFLYDFGYVSTPEPFQKLINQGMILGTDGQKMSKSRGNVVNPDKVITAYGADSMRLYEMFMGPLEATKPWNMQGVEGVNRFLQKFWRAVIDEETGNLSQSVQDVDSDDETIRLLHKTIKKVSNDIDNFGFNTAISAMMIFVNHLVKMKIKPKSAIEKFVLILAPFAPHIAEEIWQKIGSRTSLAYEPWPNYDPQLIKEAQIELAVQIKGKIKDKIVVDADTTEEKIKEIALSSEKVIAAMQGKEPEKIIVIKSRLVNIIV